MKENRENIEILYKDNIEQTNMNNYTVEKKVEEHKRSISKKNRFENVKVKREKNDPIAIIGMSGRFPGADNIDEMWKVLLDGKEMITEFPKERIHDTTKNDSSLSGGWLSDISKFDNAFFGILPKEAELMDPRQRLLLEESWKALEDAGYGEKEIKNNVIGMFVGAENSDYQYLSDLNSPVTANHNGILAARLAYYLDFSGPNMSINTACSSGLVALHQAILSLKNNECDTAIVGGVNLVVIPETLIPVQKAGMISKSGKCFAFDERSDGMVPGEAIAVVVLKKLSQAEKDKDPIYVIINGDSINYDGKTNGITSPSGVAQTNLIKMAYDRNNINPEDIEYVVTHGTGTKLGDPVEVNALYDAFKEYTDKNEYCAITSTKTNFGHTFAASGLVSLICLVESLTHKMIPRSLNFDKRNEYIKWNDSPLYVNTQNKPWVSKKRMGAVNAFGMSGTNVHIVLSNHEQEEYKNINSYKPCYLIPISAKSKESLERMIDKLIAFLNKDIIDDMSLANLSYTFLEGRQHFRYRCILVVEDRKELLYTLEKVKKSEKMKNCFEGIVNKDFEEQNVMKKYYNELLTKSVYKTNEYIEYREILNALAEAFCTGYNFDWSKLFNESNIRKIHAPTYIFDEKRYWIKEKVNVSNTNKNTTIKENYSISKESKTNTKEIKIDNRSKNKVTLVSLEKVDLSNEPQNSSVNNNRKIKLNNNEYSVKAIEKEINKRTEIKEANNLIEKVESKSIEEMLINTFIEVTSISPQNVDLETPFIDMGLDSIIGIEWINKVNKLYGTSFTADIIYEYNTLGKFRDHLVELMNAGSIGKVEEHRVDQNSIEYIEVADDETILESDENNSIDSIQQKLILSLVECLGVENEKIDVNEKFIDLGIDSIIGIEWINAVNKMFKVNIDISSIYQYPTIKDMTVYIIDLISDKSNVVDTVHKIVEDFQKGNLNIDQTNDLLNKLKE